MTKKYDERLSEASTRVFLLANGLASVLKPMDAAAA
jgi:hypothetical protein